MCPNVQISGIDPGNISNINNITLQVTSPSCSTAWAGGGDVRACRACVPRSQDSRWVVLLGRHVRGSGACIVWQPWRDTLLVSFIYYPQQFSVCLECHILLCCLNTGRICITLFRTCQDLFNLLQRCLGLEPLIGFMLLLCRFSIISQYFCFLSVQIE